MRKNAISQDDYEKLKVFAVLFVEWFIPNVSTRPEDQILVFLANLEKKSLSQAKQGLQMAVNDLIEMTVDWLPEKIAAADTRFGSHSTFALSEVRRRYSKKYLQILKRGYIKSEQEYYLLKGVADGNSIETGATERGEIESMLQQYEKMVINKVSGVTGI